MVEQSVSVGVEAALYGGEVAMLHECAYARAVDVSLCEVKAGSVGFVHGARVRSRMTGGMDVMMSMEVPNAHMGRKELEERVSGVKGESFVVSLDRVMRAVNGTGVAMGEMGAGMGQLYWRARTCEVPPYLRWPPKKPKHTYTRESGEGSRINSKFRRTFGAS